MSREDKLRAYMELLAVRMPPAQFDALSRALQAFSEHLASGAREGSFHVDDSVFTAGMREEFSTLIALVMTGRLDYWQVPIPEPDGRVGWALVSEEVATDPVKLREAQAKLRQLAAKWDQEEGAGGEGP